MKLAPQHTALEACHGATCKPRSQVRQHSRGSQATICSSHFTSELHEAGIIVPAHAVSATGWYSQAHCEPPHTAVQRANAVAGRLWKAAAATAGGAIILVTHAEFGSNLLGHLLGVPVGDAETPPPVQFCLDNASTSAIELDSDGGGCCQVAWLNRTNFLQVLNK